MEMEVGLICHQITYSNQENRLRVINQTGLLNANALNSWVSLAGSRRTVRQQSATCIRGLQSATTHNGGIRILFA